MKKILLLLTIALALLTGCEKDPVVDKGKLDPNAMILIRPAKGVQTRAQVAGLTGLEVVEQALNIKWQSHWNSNVYYDDAKDVARTFMESQKDYETPALKMLGIDVITMEGDYYRDLTYAFNVVITDVNNDTIAYIPDGVISAAKTKIEAAFNDENYTEVYRLFDEAFTFLPVE